MVEGIGATGLPLSVTLWWENTTPVHELSSREVGSGIVEMGGGGGRDGEGGSEWSGLRFHPRRPLFVTRRGALVRDHGGLHPILPLLPTPCLIFIIH